MPLVTASSRFILPALIAITLLQPRSAHAEPSDEQRAQARDAMSAGRAARNAQDLNTALQRFTEADGIMHVPTTGLEVAKTKASLGLLVEARETALAVASSPAQADEPAPFQKARDAASELAAELAHRVGTLRVTFSGTEDVDQISVRLDGKDVELEALSSGAPINPGAHHLTAQAGTSRTARAFDVAEGQTQSLDLELAADAQPLPPSTSAEKHDATAASRASKVPTLSYVFGGVALASAGSGLAFGLLGNHRRADLEHNCSPNCSDTSVHSVKTLYTLADASFAVSLGALITAIVAYAAEPQTREPHEARLPAQRQLGFTLLTDRSAAQLGLSGSF